MYNCTGCRKRPAQIKRPSTGQPACRQCFFDAFENEVHDYITGNHLFNRGEKVAVAISGGKDSTVLAHILTTLNSRHDYGLNLFLLAIDEGITGYRDDSLETVKRNEQQFKIPLRIASYEQLFGWRMDDIVRMVGTKNNCTFCGVLRRRALDLGAMAEKADKLCTGHNLDDAAETALMNVLRGDFTRLGRSAGEGTALPMLPARVKPLSLSFEKEIVLYAHFKKLDYFSTECTYSVNAFRGNARTFVKLLERDNPKYLRNLVSSAEQIHLALNQTTSTLPRKDASTLQTCTQCSLPSSSPICKVCVLLAGLNQRKPKAALGRKQKDIKFDTQTEHQTAAWGNAGNIRFLNVANLER